MADERRITVEDDAGRKVRVKEASQHPFSEGDRVRILHHKDDTGTVRHERDSIPVSELDDEGEVVEARLHPPHVPEDRRADPDNDNPSPHCLVRLKHPRGTEHDVWVNAARLEKLGRGGRR